MQFFIIYVPSQELQGQLQTDTDTGDHIMDKYKIKDKLHASTGGNNNNNNNVKFQDGRIFANFCCIDVNRICTSPLNRRKFCGFCH
jgi:hypothetical protein